VAKKNREDLVSKRLANYQAVFNSPTGQEVLNDLMKVHYIMTPTISTESLTMAHREGERNVVLRILTILNMNLTQLRERIKEDAKIRDDENIVCYGRGVTGLV